MAQIATKTSEDTKSAQNDSGYTYETTKPDKTSLEIVVKVGAKLFQQQKSVEFNKLAPEVNISGFRPGKAPKNLIEARLGARLFEETINSLMPIVTAEIVENEEINPLDYAKYTVQKVSDEGLEYKALFSVLPNIEMPDFKKLAVKKGDVKVAKDEIDKLFMQLKEDILKSKKKSEKVEEDSKSEESVKSDDSKDAVKPVKAEKSDEKIDWAKELNDKSLDSEEKVREQLEKSLQSRKEGEVEDQYVNDLVKAAIEKAEITAPSSLMHAEAHRRERDYVGRIEKLGLKVEDFLKAQSIDMETLRKNWHSDAELTIASDILFISVAKAHDIKVTEEEIDAEIAKVQDEKLREQYSSPGGRNYISSVIIRQKAVNKMKELAA